MLVIGTMNWPSTRGQGQFYCPNCNRRQDYRLKVSRPFLTLYFVPVIPLGGLQEYVQCAGCKTAFEPDVIHAPPPVEAAESLDFNQDLLMVMALVLLEDGLLTEPEIDTAQHLYQSMTQSELTTEKLTKTCGQVRQRRLKIDAFLAACAGRRSLEEKLLLVQAMFGVAAAEGEISPGRLTALSQSQSILAIDSTEFQRAVNATLDRVR